MPILDHKILQLTKANIFVLFPRNENSCVYSVCLKVTATMKGIIFLAENLRNFQIRLNTCVSSMSGIVLWKPSPVSYHPRNH